MFNGAVSKAEKGRASRVMVGWLAVWQAAKKGFESFSICDLFFKRGSRAHMLPACTCRRPQSRDCSHLTLSRFCPPVTLCPASVTCHMDVIAHKTRRMRVESMAASTRTHTRTQTKLPPTHMSEVLLCFHTVMFQSISLYGRRRVLEEYCFCA